jgi:hypothetical protein
MKSAGWFRFYNRMIDSPQILELSDSEFRLIVSLWCLASMEGGTIHYSIKALRRRIMPDKDEEELKEMINHLKELDLLIEEEGYFRIPRWEIHQYEYRHEEEKEEEEEEVKKDRKEYYKEYMRKYRNKKSVNSSVNTVNNSVNTSVKSVNTNVNTPVNTVNTPVNTSVNTVNIPVNIPVNNSHSNNILLEKDTELDKELDTEKENINNNIILTSYDEQSCKKRKKSTKRSYSENANKFYELFRDYRENILKIPITKRDWHLKTLSIGEKLLKKYSLDELSSAIRDLGEIKDYKVIEPWHFEDFLTKWKAEKLSKEEKDGKYRRDIEDDEFRKADKWLEWLEGTEDLYNVVLPPFLEKYRKVKAT